MTEQKHFTIRKLDEACKRFGIAYDTARMAVSVCKAIESDVRTSDLTFTHHHLVANRDDAKELLDWAVGVLVSTQESSEWFGGQSDDIDSTTQETTNSERREGTQ